MNEKSKDRGKMMEILSKSQCKDEIIDELDMSDLDLTFSDLSEVMAKRVILRASSLMRVSFRDCDFELADFINCNLVEPDIADCRFGEANFSKTNIKYAKINISDCFETCFDEVNFFNGELVRTILNYAMFRHVNLSGIDAE
ncbi:hypothetical protein CN354_12650 [Bacillus cereus]|nr:hypothetical protein CN354_12650 [Bacillus cereus]